MTRTLITLLLVGCAPTTGDPVDETGYLDVQLLRYSAEVDLSDAPAPVRVVGLPGVLDAGGEVSLSNLSSNVDGALVRGPDGDFVGSVEAMGSDELEIVQTIAGQAKAATLTLVQDFSDVDPLPNFPASGPLYPLPEDGFTEMDMSQTALQAPFVLFNSESAASLRVTDTTAPIRIPAAVGDEICAFPEDVGDGLPGFFFCNDVSDQPAAL